MNSIVLKPQLKELYELNNFINYILPDENFLVDLIVEEVFVNIVNYSKTDFIKVNADYENETLTVEFIDNGVEFNPLLRNKPDFPDDIDEAEIGGLGIHLTKEISDSIAYDRINGENHLNIKKRVKQ